MSFCTPINILAPKAPCLPVKGGVKNIWIANTEDITGITITPITGVIDTETEGRITAITMLTGSKFYPLNPISNTVDIAEDSPNGVLSQTINFQYAPNSQLSREIAAKLQDCTCGYSLIVFYGDESIGLIHGTVTDAYGNVVNNSPLRVTNTNHTTTAAAAERSTFTITLARENGDNAQFSRLLDMSVANINALLSPAP